MFLDYTKYNHETQSYPESILASWFEVSGSGVNETAVLIGIGAVVSVAIGISLLTTQSVGSNLFWIGSVDVLLGLGMFALAAVDRHLTHNRHQNRMLHRCQTIEEYTALLATDVGVDYQVKITAFVEKNSREGNEIFEQTNKDIPRSRWMLNGKQYDGKWEDIKIANPNVLQFANHGVHIEETNALNARYQIMGPFTVILSKSKTDPGKWGLSFNLILDETKKEAIALETQRISQLKWGEEAPIILMEKYLISKTRVDFKTGDAVISWSSPQNERPKGF
jgi:hypothetical protein